MEILTNSRAKAFRRCARLHHLQYDLGYRAVVEEAALRFGTLVHAGLEAWWKGAQDDESRIGAAIVAMRALHGDGESLEIVQAEELLLGYHARWGAEPYDVIAVEAEFRAPLVNPETGAPSRTFELGGKLDGLARHRLTGRVVIVEHKTSAEDITAGSKYWQRLRMDSQVSTYFAGAEALGHPADACLYDVLGKPRFGLAQATPLESRKYTQPKFKACPECKKKTAQAGPHAFAVDPETGDLVYDDCHGADSSWEVRRCEPDPENTAKRRVCTDPGGKLYAGLRDRDETLEEYRLRLREDIAGNPDRYYQRGEVVRLEEERREYQADTWQTASTMRDCRRLQIAPRNPDGCFTYSRACQFFDVCTGAASLDDTTRFKRLDNVHPELAAESAA